MKSTGYINEHGEYVRGAGKSLGHDISSMHKGWRQGIERKEYGKEIIQPFKDGKPNPAFVKAYDDEGIADEYFTPEQIKVAEREV